MKDITPVDDILAEHIRAGHERGLTWAQIEALTGANKTQIKHILGDGQEDVAQSVVKKRQDLDVLIGQMKADPASLALELVAESIAIADELANDPEFQGTRLQIQAAKMRIDTRQFMASRLNPERFGSRPAETRDDTVRFIDMTGFKGDKSEGDKSEGNDDAKS